MTTTPVSSESLHVLSRAVVEHANAENIRTRTTMLTLCIESVAFGLECGRSGAATRARSAAHLLLEMTYPDLDADTLHELSIACERAATCG